MFASVRFLCFLAAAVLANSLAACSSSGEPGAWLAQSVRAAAEEAKPVTPESLLDLIRLYQRREVRLSVGEWAYQCFTDVDFQNFVERKRPMEVARALKGTKRFAEITKAIAALPEPAQKELLDRARNLAHPTWAQQGRITTDGSGQTDSGRLAPPHD
jgi:hypothetical protein